MSSAILLIAIFLGMAAAYFFFFGIGERKKTLKRIELIKKRRGQTAKTGSESLRRKTNEARGITYWLSKPLPDIKRLGDILERAGKTTTPKQYLLRALQNIVFSHLRSLRFI